MPYYLFAKFFQHLSIEQLMDACLQIGVDGPTALVREGYWIEPTALRDALPRFVRKAQEYGLAVRYADTSFPMDVLARDPAIFQTLAEHGISWVRVGNVSRRSVPHVRELADRTRLLADSVATAAEKAGVKAVVQIHGGDLYPHNATSAYAVVRDLNPAAIGVKVDPGNSIVHVGDEGWDYQIPLLGEYVAALGAKDGCSVRTPDAEGPKKGWTRRFVPVDEGETDWEEVYRLLHGIGFGGPVVLMPFYRRLCEAEAFPGVVKREVEYLKGIAQRTRSDGGAPAGGSS